MKAIHGIQVGLGALIFMAQAMSHSPDSRLAAIGDAAVQGLLGVLTLIGLVSHSALPSAAPPPSGGTP